MPRRADPPAPLEVTGSLAFTLDDLPGGRVEAGGSRIVVAADDPVAAWRAAAAPGPGRPALGGLGDLLADAGLVMEVTGPRGTVATMGDGVDSSLGRLVAGSRHVRPGGLRAVRPLASARAGDLLRPTADRAARLLLLAVAAVVLRRLAGLPRQARRRG